MHDYSEPMYRTSSRLWNDDLRTRLALTGQQNPEWQPWLRLLETALREMEEPLWAASEPQLRLDRPAGAPLLAGAVLTLDRRSARDWVRRLLEQARSDAGAPVASRPAAESRSLDALSLLEAAICQDEARLTSLSVAVGMDPLVLGTVGHLAAMPVLSACGRSLGHQIPLDWPYGYCPVCGARATLAELRGIERTHRLRCARCGGDWGMTLLRCPYCGENDHQRLAALVPEDGGEVRKVAACMTCQGYVKTLTTLQANPGYMLPVEDMATVDLDIIALECGYTRPKRPGYALGLRVLATPNRLRTLLGWHW
jgi:FdhE protein